MHRSLLGAAAATAAALVLAAPAGAAAWMFGSPGLGDPFFPLAGNGGYDVGHYGLTLDYDRSGNRPLEGSTMIMRDRYAVRSIASTSTCAASTISRARRSTARRATLHARRPGAA